MLDLVEKITHGLCAVLVLTVAVLYLWKGTRDTDPPEFLPSAIASTLPHRPSGGGGGGGKADGGAKRAVASGTQQSRDRAEDRDLLKELRNNTPRAQRLERKYMKVPQTLFEYARKDINWIPQLKHVGRQDIDTKDGHTRMMLTHMPPNSLLRKFGVQPEDVIEMIDGERFIVDEASTAQYKERAAELFSKLENGGSVGVTLTRNNSPVHLVFQLP